MLPYTRYSETRYAFDPRRQAVWSVIAAYLQRYVPESGSVLDLGSGYCDFINSIRAERRWALDLYIDPAKHVAGDITPLNVDVADLSAIDEGTLDVVFASNVLEHLEDDKLVATVDAVRRRLKDGGRLILLQPNFRYCYRTYFDDFTHCRIFTHVSLANFVESRGFRIERVSGRFLPFSMKGRTPTWRFLVWLYLRSPWKPGAGQMLVVARKSAAAVAAP